MTLRVHAPPPPPALAGLETEASQGDGWATRLAKLVPAEALGLYGAATSVIPVATAAFPAASRTIALYILAAVCLLFSAAIRWNATFANGRPQYPAMAIAVISFVIWLAALGPPNSPLELPVGYRFVAPLCAIVWASVVSYFYKGDPAPAP